MEMLRSDSGFIFFNLEHSVSVKLTSSKLSAVGCCPKFRDLVMQMLETKQNHAQTNYTLSPTLKSSDLARCLGSGALEFSSAPYESCTHDLDSTLLERGIEEVAFY